ncbi:MAG: arsenate reductase (glutaredoxin) [Pseudomonadales bacterium]|jgi:arsenate reductase
MNKVTIYHNPSCSKSRATLALLTDRNIKPEIVLYKENPPSAAALQTIVTQLGITPRELLRKGEAAYEQKGLENSDLTDVDLIQAMVDAPILIERPIVICGDKAAIGRPPEHVLDIL